MSLQVHLKNGRHSKIGMCNDLFCESLKLCVFILSHMLQNHVVEIWMGHNPET